MSNVETWKNGILRELWNDTTRQYSAWTAQGAPVINTPRAYTEQENLEADARIAADVPTNNQRTLEDGLDVSITSVKAGMDQANLDLVTTNATMNQNPAQYIKNLDRAYKDLARGFLRLAKIQQEQFQDADTGAA